ncbi:MAG: hypothetical protein ACRYGI_13240 [Janthinobacterium lividum]
MIGHGEVLNSAETVTIDSRQSFEEMHVGTSVKRRKAVCSALIVQLDQPAVSGDARTALAAGLQPPGPHHPGQRIGWRGVICLRKRRSCSYFRPLAGASDIISIETWFTFRRREIEMAQAGSTWHS